MASFSSAQQGGGDEDSGRGVRGERVSWAFWDSGHGSETTKGKIRASQPPSSGMGRAFHGGLNAMGDGLTATPPHQGTGELESVVADNWTPQTIDSWRHSIWVGVWDPWIVVFKGPKIWYRTIREIVTLERMHRAFDRGLMEYGMIKSVKKGEEAQGLTASMPEATPSQVPPLPFSHLIRVLTCQGPQKGAHPPPRSPLTSGMASLPPCLTTISHAGVMELASPCGRPQALPTLCRPGMPEMPAAVLRLASLEFCRGSAPLDPARVLHAHITKCSEREGSQGNVTGRMRR